MSVKHLFSKGHFFVFPSVVAVIQGQAYLYASVMMRGFAMTFYDCIMCYKKVKIILCCYTLFSSLVFMHTLQY